MDSALIATLETRPVRNSEVLGFAALLGAIKLLFGGYSFGLRDQIIQLCYVFRILDSEYLANDYFVNHTEAYGVRYFFSHISACFAQWLPLPPLYLIFTFLIHVAVVWVTWKAARLLFQNSTSTAFVAAALVLTLDPFSIGGAGWLTLNYYKPAYLARPLVYAVLLMSLSNRVLPCLVLSLIATLIHPLMGVETGGLAFVVMGLALLIPSNSNEKEPWQIPWQRIILVTVCTLVLLIFTILLWVVPMKSSLNTELFLKIWYLRGATATFPGSYRPQDYIDLATFLLVFSVALFLWRRWIPSQRKMSLLIATFVLQVVLLCIFGYVFVEMIPSRLGMVLWTFRLLYIVKWLGIIIITGVLAQWMLYGDPPRWSRACAFLQHYISERFATLILCVVSGGLLFVLGWSMSDSHPLPGLLSLLVAWWMWRGGGQRMRWLLPLAALCLLTLAASTPSLAASKLFRHHGPVTLWEGYATNPLPPGAEGVAGFVRDHTDPDSVFLTPPHFGLFRIATRRALIVDYRTFPHYDSGMLDWWTRIRDCYGDMGTLNNIQGRLQMDTNYHSITTENILQVAKKYGAHYAVLYTGTASALPVLYKDKDYTLVDCRQ